MEKITREGELRRRMEKSGVFRMKKKKSCLGGIYRKKRQILAIRSKPFDLHPPLGPHTFGCNV